MDVKDYIRYQFEFGWGQVDSVMEGVTDEVFNWQPPGVAHPIKSAFLHLLTSEDFFVHIVFQGQPMVWVTGDWGAKIGLSAPPGRGQGWDELRGATVSLAPILAYRDAVRAETRAFLAGLTDVDLQRPITFVNRQRPLYEMLVLSVSHMTGHAGEIAALKGVQGVRGLAF